MVTTNDECMSWSAGPYNPHFLINHIIVFIIYLLDPTHSSNWTLVVNFYGIYAVKSKSEVNCFLLLVK